MVLGPLCCCNKNTDKNCNRFRRVTPVHLLPNEKETPTSSSKHPHHGYCKNEITTTKYNLLTFLPKNLFEQFHRVANIIFLLIGLLNFVPEVNALVPEVALVPLMFVLSITAVKDAYEDYRRYRSDKEINHLPCRKYSREEHRYVKTQWKDVRVGDLIHLSCNEAIPADLVLLRSSDENGVCRIDTSNLDGENNLKQRVVAKGISQSEEYQPTMFTHEIECDQPNIKLYNFQGSLITRLAEKIPISNDNLLLRGCIIRNTDFIEGIVVYAGHETKAMLNNRGPRYKRSKIEHRINIDILWSTLILMIMCFLSALGHYLWLDAVNSPRQVPYLQFSDDDYYKPFYSSFLIFWTYVIVYQGFIPLALYVTVELVKLGQVYFIQEDLHMYHPPTDKRIQCKALNITEELGQVEHVFSDKTGTLTENQMVFRRCTIGGVDYAYPPREAPSMPNTPAATDDNMSVFTMDPSGPGMGRDGLVTSTSMVELSATPNGVHNNRYSSTSQLHVPDSQPTTPTHTRFLPDPVLHKAVSRMSLHSLSAVSEHRSTHDETPRIQEFFLIMAICNTVVVTAQPHHDNMDESGTIHNDPEPKPAATRFIQKFKKQKKKPPSSPLKTKSPTRLRNATSLSSTASNGHLVSSSQESLAVSTVSMSPSPFDGISNASAAAASEPSTSGETEEGASAADNRSLNTLVSENPEGCYYEAESPDELALTQAACMYGCKLLNRNMDTATVWLPAEGEEVHFDILHILPFDSQRKRMSVIVRLKNKTVVLYTKGADSAIFANLKPFSEHDDYDEHVYSKTQQYITEYAKQGLRTLCMAKKILSIDEYDSWLSLHHQAEMDITNRQQLLHESACRIEQHLTLLGATGIEDRLQDGVGETIASLRQAGIKVWVLTGDKQETAMNIGYSCQLLSFDQQVIALNAKDKERTKEILTNHLESIEGPTFDNLRYSPAATDGTASAGRALVIDGTTLAYALDTECRDMFVRLTTHCGSVLCCRATPSQKAAVVTLVKEKLKKLSLAIGDGANDVSMIQTADVGVGISGQEGMQAVMASDFALARFRFLQRLLLVHGHWSYDRLARMICLMYTKNCTFVFLLMWYQIYNAFSGIYQVDEINLLLFSIVFTSIPPIMMGVLDQNLPDQALMHYPSLYKRSQLSKSYGKSDFFIAVADALWQSCVQFFIPYMVYRGTDVGIWELGMVMNNACVLSFLVHYCIETSLWHTLHIAVLALNLVVFVLVNVIVSFLSPAIPPFSTAYRLYENTLSSSTFWLILPVIIVLALLPRFLMRSLQASLWPHRCLRLRQHYKKLSQHPPTHPHVPDLRANDVYDTIAPESTGVAYQNTRL